MDEGQAIRRNRDGAWVWHRVTNAYRLMGDCKCRRHLDNNRPAFASTSRCEANVLRSINNCPLERRSTC